MSAGKKLASAEQDPGRYLPALAVSYADRARMPAKQLSWSEALAAAPWDPSLPAAWEGAFRRAYAGRLVELGVAREAGRASSTRGTSLSDEDRATRGLGRLTLRLRQSAIDRLTAEAERVGCSRATLVESLIGKL